MNAKAERLDLDDAASTLFPQLVEIKSSQVICYRHRCEVVIIVRIFYNVLLKCEKLNILLLGSLHTLQEWKAWNVDLLVVFFLKAEALLQASM